MASVWGQDQAQNGAQSNQVQDVKQTLTDVQEKISNLQKRVSQDNVATIQGEMQTVQSRVDDIANMDIMQHKDLKQELQETRNAIDKLQKDTDAAQEQQKWHLESRVSTADPVTFVWDIDRFNSILDNNELVVAYFYQLSDKEQEIKSMNGVRRRTDRWYTVEQNVLSLVSVAERDLYQRAGVTCVAVNLDEDQLDRLKTQYDLKARDTIVLFKGGVPYTESKLIGPFDTHDIRSYVKEYFEDLAKERIEDIDRKREQRKPRKEKVRYVYDDYDRPRFGFGFGYGSPYHDRYYWGHPYGHRRHYGHPGFSIGFGW